MNEENTTIMPPEEQIVQDDRDARAEELESTFSYDGYQVVRKELFAHLRDPAIVIRKDSITFNTACITGLENVVYVHVMFNNDLKCIVVRGCDENDKDALRWCVAKPDKRKSRKMSCKPFATLVYFVKTANKPTADHSRQPTVGSIRSPYFLFAAHFVGQNRAAPKPPTYNFWIPASPLPISK